MRKTIAGALALAMALTSMPALAKEKGSSGRQAQAKGTREIPRCTRNLGAIAIVEPDNQWWREYNLGSPEAILKIFVQQSRCFTIVNRGRSMQSRAMERAMADQGELQAGSNLGRGQVKAADYFLEPNIVSANRNSGGNALGGVLGGIGGGLFGRGAGALLGGINIKKGEANVTLSVVDARTTEEKALVEGYYRKSDLGWGAGGGLFSGGTFAAAGAGGYQDTAIGQILALAHLDAHTKMGTHPGGPPEDGPAAAPQAK